MADMKDLEGTTVWVSAGGQLGVLPLCRTCGATMGRLAGTLLGAEPLVVKDVVEQVAPKSGYVSDSRVATSRCCWCFTKPDDTKEYAVPMGYRQAGQYTFYTDEILFYDDPHVLYKHWGPEIWKAVDSHHGHPRDE